MSETISFSPTLVLKGSSGARRIACRACGHELGASDGVWKEHALLDERPLGEAGGGTFRTEGDVLFRRFYCPSCGTTLDAETALPGEPFLIDRVRS
ncbi:MAG TPA: acetone carboxylase subunit gamma [Rhizobiaceae bacterium]|nr:acetone carboxylase subunit gamma [Rhizobiaceae bacterium]